MSLKKSEKEKNWKRGELEVNKITDKLGKRIDSRIKKIVTALRVYGFSTSASCGGHSTGEGFPYPWVEIYIPEPMNWKKDEKIQEKWKIENLREQEKMTKLLTGFYKNKNTHFDVRLSFRPIGILGGFRIQSFSADQMPLFSKEKQKGKLKKYRKEMDDFAEFLKNKYLVE